MRAHQCWVVAVLMMVGGSVAHAAPPAEGSRGRASSPAALPPVPVTPDFGKTAPALVAKVMDGRTIVVQTEQGQEVVALLGVAPVKINDEHEPSDASAVDAVEAAAVAFLTNLLKGESVYVVDHEKGRRSDAQGRRLCSVYRAPDGLLVNLELVRQGYAKVSDEPSSVLATAMKPWGQLASERRRGAYGMALPAASGAIKPTADKAKPTTVKPASLTPTDDQPATADGMVFITKSGTKYHRADCRYAKTGSEVSVDDAKKKGLQPCGVCKPD